MPKGSIGFEYARGPYNTADGTAASAFSKGDILMLDSTSSLSRVPPAWASGVDWVGIALSDSVDSIDGKVPYLIPEADTDLWASISTALTSHLTPGVESDIIFAVANGRYYLDGSTNSVRAQVVRGTAGPQALSQSIVSKALVRLIKHAGNAEF